MSEIQNRDQVIFRLIQVGMPCAVLSKKLGISTMRIRQIYNNQYYKNYHGDPDIPEIDIMCRTLGMREQERGKLQSILHKNGYTNYDDRWRELSYDDICSITLLGPTNACVVWLAQNMKT